MLDRCGAGAAVCLRRDRRRWAATGRAADAAASAGRRWRRRNRLHHQRLERLGRDRRGQRLADQRLEGARRDRIGILVILVGTARAEPPGLALLGALLLDCLAELLVVQVGIQPALLEQLAVCADLDDLAIA